MILDDLKTEQQGTMEINIKT